MDFEAKEVFEGWGVDHIFYLLEIWAVEEQNVLALNDLFHELPWNVVEMLGMLEIPSERIADYVRVIFPMPLLHDYFLSCEFLICNPMVAEILSEGLLRDNPKGYGGDLCRCEYPNKPIFSPSATLSMIRWITQHLHKSNWNDEKWQEMIYWPLPKEIRLEIMLLLLPVMNPRVMGTLLLSKDEVLLHALLHTINVSTTTAKANVIPKEEGHDLQGIMFASMINILLALDHEGHARNIYEAFTALWRKLVPHCPSLSEGAEPVLLNVNGKSFPFNLSSFANWMGMLSGGHKTDIFSILAINFWIGKMAQVHPAMLSDAYIEFIHHMLFNIDGDGKFGCDGYLKAELRKIYDQIDLRLLRPTNVLFHLHKCGMPPKGSQWGALLTLELGNWEHGRQLQILKKIPSLFPFQWWPLREKLRAWRKGVIDIPHSSHIVVDTGGLTSIRLTLQNAIQFLLIKAIIPMNEFYLHEAIFNLAADGEFLPIIQRHFSHAIAITALPGKNISNLREATIEVVSFISDGIQARHVPSEVEQLFGRAVHERYVPQLCSKSEAFMLLLVHSWIFCLWEGRQMKSFPFPFPPTLRGEGSVQVLADWMATCLCDASKRASILSKIEAIFIGYYIGRYFTAGDLLSFVDPL